MADDALSPKVATTAADQKTITELKKKKSSCSSSDCSIKVSMQNCAGRQLRSNFGKEPVRVSQLAASTVGDVLYMMCSRILLKAMELMAGKKTLTSDGVLAAAHVICPVNISVSAQNIWAGLLTEVRNKVAEWAPDKDTRKETSGGVSVRINEMMREKGNYMDPTAMKRIIRNALTGCVRQQNDLPAVALSYLCAAVVDGMCNTIKNSDDKWHAKITSGKGITLAPKHIYRAMQINEIYSKLLGDQLNAVGAPVGVLEKVGRRKRARRISNALMQSPIMTGVGSPMMIVTPPMSPMMVDSVPGSPMMSSPEMRSPPAKKRRAAPKKKKAASKKTKKVTVAKKAASKKKKKAAPRDYAASPRRSPRLAKKH